jgi:hypothetical protein
MHSLFRIPQSLPFILVFLAGALWTALAIELVRMFITPVAWDGEPMFGVVLWLNALGWVLKRFAIGSWSLALGILILNRSNRSQMPGSRGSTITHAA